MADPAMTPPAAGWDAERAAQEMWAECMGGDQPPFRTIHVSSGLGLEIFARHLILARSTAPSAEAMREAAATLLDQHRAVIQQATKTANETEAMIYMAQVEYLEETAAIVRALPLPPAQPSADATGDLVSKQAVIDLLSRLAAQDGDLALYGLPENARGREYGEATLARARCAVALLAPAQPSAVGDADAEVERILAMTDAEVIADAEARGEDIAETAAHCRAIFERASANVAAQAPNEIPNGVRVGLAYFLRMTNSHASGQQDRMEVRSFLARLQSPTPAGDVT